ncbi:hypothetical protein M514_01265 [Trichuris suis]|uniref:Uncharacterized protein n=1 Tax=Trichuris suis TaxID=68888 RepID=A0A085NMT8_9BILA|nr:hypothetical protein M513_01265 [Trichuris suis]KFD70784.1 hypothetical protein M514_01265 [Trichuris suis]
MKCRCSNPIFSEMRWFEHVAFGNGAKVSMCITVELFIFIRLHTEQTQVEDDASASRRRNVWDIIELMVRLCLGQPTFHSIEACRFRMLRSDLLPAKENVERWFHSMTDIGDK